MEWADWLSLFTQYTILSLMAVGGVMTTLPEMHRYLVAEHQLLSDQQFNASVAIAQASPGPNILFVALLGWNVGFSTGSIGAAFLGAAVTLGGILLPSTCFTYFAARWVNENGELRAVRAFRQGLAPIVVALLLASAWTLARANDSQGTDWALWLVTAVSGLFVWFTKVHILWLLAAAGALGWFGWL